METAKITITRYADDGSININLSAHNLNFMIHMERDPSESGWNLVRSGVPLGGGGLTMGLVDASELVAVFNKAERAQDFEDDFARVKAEDHAGDEVHCSCVIHLRRHIEELKAEIATLKQPFSLHIDTAGSRLWKRGEQCQHERTYTAEATICRRCSVAVEPSQPTSDIYCNNCLLPADKCRHKTRALSRYTAEEIERMRRERGPSVHAEDPFEDYVRSLDGVAKDVTVYVTGVFGGMGGPAAATHRRPLGSPLRCKQHGLYGRVRPLSDDDPCPKCGSRPEL